MKIRAVLYDGSSIEIEEGGPDESTSLDDTSDSSVVSVASDSSIGGDSSVPGDDGETSVHIADTRPFLSTPLDDYNVTEGLLLVLLIFAGLAAIIALFRGR